MEDYKVLREIGKGSFGKVYLVRHVKEGKPYVIKVIKVKGMPLKERCVPLRLAWTGSPFCMLPLEDAQSEAGSPFVLEIHQHTDTHNSNCSFTPAPL